MATTTTTSKILIALDPGWTNLGYVLTSYDGINPLRVQTGVYDTKIPHKTKDYIKYIMGIGNFIKDVLEPFVDGLGLYEVIAIIIEQQHKQKYTYHIFLQEMLESNLFVHFAQRDSVRGKNCKICRYTAVSTKRFFGTYQEGASYDDRKNHLFERINQIAADPEEKQKYPLVVAVGTHHEADALACLNVYINKTHKHELHDVGIKKIVKKKPPRKNAKSKTDSTNQKPKTSTPKKRKRSGGGGSTGGGESSTPSVGEIPNW